MLPEDTFFKLWSEKCKMMCYINHDILVTMVTKRTRWPTLFLLKFTSVTLKESLYQIWGKFMEWKFCDRITLRAFLTASPPSSLPTPPPCNLSQAKDGQRWSLGGTSCFVFVKTEVVPESSWNNFVLLPFAIFSLFFFLDLHGDCSQSNYTVHP